MVYTVYLFSLFSRSVRNRSVKTSEKLSTKTTLIALHFKISSFIPNTDSLQQDYSPRLSKYYLSSVSCRKSHRLFSVYQILTPYNTLKIKVRGCLNTVRLPYAEGKGICCSLSIKYRPPSTCWRLSQQLQLLFGRFVWIIWLGSYPSGINNMNRIWLSRISVLVCLVPRLLKYLTFKSFVFEHLRSLVPEFSYLVR